MPAAQGTSPPTPDAAQRGDEAKARARGKVHVEMRAISEQIKLAQTDIEWTQERLAEQQQRLADLEDDYLAMQDLLAGLG